MININDIKINQKVWFKEHWTERIVCGFVSEIAKRSDNEDYIIEVKGVILGGQFYWYYPPVTRQSVCNKRRSNYCC